MVWLYVIGAAIVEVMWVLGLKYASSIAEWLGTIIAIIFSFFLVIKAAEKLPTGTVYAVFTGLGAAAIVSMDFIFFGEKFSLGKLFFIGLIMFGVIGIKVTTETKEDSSSLVFRGGE